MSASHHSNSIPDHLNLSSSDDDTKPPPPKPERKLRKKTPSSIPQPPQIQDDDLNGTSADSIREQLMALESMYKDILQVGEGGEGRGRESMSWSLLCIIR